MDMTGERRIAAPRQVVWDALNDPAVLKASIPGCESLEKTSDTQMKATAAVKIGPISARFNGNVQLTDIDPPNGYNIGGEGQGGVAGFAKGGAKVALTDDAGATLLRYEVHAQVGGKLAQLGARLIDATAKQMADAFFTRFTAQVEGAGQAAQPAAAELATAESAAAHPSAAQPAPTQPVTAQPAPAQPDAAQPARVAAQPTAAAAAQRPSPAQTPPIPQTMPDNLRAAPVETASALPPVRNPPINPPMAISPLALIPREPLGLPMAFWLGGAAFAVIVLLFLGSSL